MKAKSQRSKEKGNLYFSDAIKQIDESLDYNEYSEINSSDYFKDSLYKAEDEVDKMMIYPLMTSFNRYKKKKLSLNLLKKHKDILINKIKLINEKCKEKEIINIKNNKPNTVKKLKIKKNYKNKSKSLESEEDEQNNNYQKINLKSENNENNSFLPPINSIHAMNTINKETNKKEDFLNRGDYSERNKRKEEPRDNCLTLSSRIVKCLSLNGNNMIKNKEKNNYKNDIKSSLFINKDYINFTDKNRIKDNNQIRETLGDMFLKCIKGVKTLESYKKKDKPRLIFHSYKSRNNRKLPKDIYTKDKQMKKYLFENIGEFYKKNKQTENLKIKAKKDTVMKLSEQFAYDNRKPLKTLFYCDKKEEKKKNSPFSQCKIKDVKKRLEIDIRNTKLLMKRLDENQKKYKKYEYLLTNKDKDKEVKNSKKKTKNNTDKNVNDEYDNDFSNKIKTFEQNEDQ